MHLEVDQNAYEFLKKKGGVCTIRLSVAKGCCGSLPLPEISYTKPKESAGLEALTQGEISVYVGKGMHFEGDIIRLSLSGAWFFRSLELPTLHLLETCDRSGHRP